MAVCSLWLPGCGGQTLVRAPERVVESCILGKMFIDLLLDELTNRCSTWKFSIWPGSGGVGLEWKSWTLAPCLLC